MSLNGKTNEKETMLSISPPLPCSLHSPSCPPRFPPLLLSPFVHQSVSPSLSVTRSSLSISHTLSISLSLLLSLCPSHSRPLVLSLLTLLSLSLLRRPPSYPTPTAPFPLPTPLLSLPSFSSLPLSFLSFTALIPPLIPLPRLFCSYCPSLFPSLTSPRSLARSLSGRQRR